MAIYVETLNVRVIEEQYISADVHITESGLSENTVEVSKKEDLAIISSMNVPVKIEQISGPVPAAEDLTGLPEVGDFVIPAEVIVLWGEGPVFEAQELLAWISLLFLTVMLTRPIVGVLPYLERAAKQARYVKIIAAVFALGTMSFGTLSAFLGGLCWWACGVTVCRIGAGVTRLREAGEKFIKPIVSYIQFPIGRICYFPIACLSYSLSFLSHSKFRFHSLLKDSRMEYILTHQD